MRSFLLAAAAFAALTGASPTQAQVQPQAAATAPLFDAMFQDHAVLQRGRPIKVWGRAAPGAAVSVSLGQAQIQATAGLDGVWRASLPTLTAGGPYVLTARSAGATQNVSDIMIGDVWLCSGQSNMEFTVRQATNAESEIGAANDDKIRLFLVGRSSLPAPSATPRAVGQWRVTSPQSVRDFSAACYFMGRDLRRAENVPVGLIAASWGGSIIEDWMSRDAVEKLGGHQQALNALDAYARDPAQGDAIWRRVTQDWWRANDPGTKQGWHLARTNDADWAPIPAEGFWESTVPGLATFDGIVWLRKEIELTAAQARQAATLELGPVDDADVTWINGQYVGGQQGWDTPRTYAVPAGTLKAGRNLIAVGVLDTNGGGGAWGPAANKRLVLADGTAVSLSSGWRHRVAAPLGDLPNPPRTPWIGGSGTTTLYNGMIAPLGAYGLKGWLGIRASRTLATMSVIAACCRPCSLTGAPGSKIPRCGCWSCNWRTSARWPVSPPTPIGRPCAKANARSSTPILWQASPSPSTSATATTSTRPTSWRSAAAWRWRPAASTVRLSPSRPSRSP